jgi:hypothetical protein
MDVGCHLLDRLDYLFGPLINVRGASKPGRGLQTLNSKSPTLNRHTYSQVAIRAYPKP